MPSSVIRISPVQNKDGGNAHEVPKSAVVPRQQGTTSAQTLNLPKAVTTSAGGSDEFKYGFPSDVGLSVLSYRWWGSGSSDPNEDDIRKEEEDVSEERKQQLAEPMDKSEQDLNTTHKINPDLVGAGLLSELREAAAKEGKEALRVGVYRGQHGLFKLDLTKRMVLLQAFKSS
ncbi:unnamed protein product [Cuscuta epithymum]|uniref:Uncharacterized protein n=1 Tax=Cuscuta epithymum TaxID=186058 RepID=A0AAV0EV18_9ASTE|nr:unnamed protein product [Cuscuta epithymum]